jgi:hypothetical protein
MSAISIEVPFPVFQDRDGQPLDNGYIWIGVGNLPPQTNPLNTYFDEALTILAQQPLRTINGYISNAGTPARVYVDAANFSILVQDSKGTMVYNTQDGTGIGPDACAVTYNPPFTGGVSYPVCEKLAQVVSVKDFGAVGDGVADDHLAIRAACDTGLPVVFPKGIYNFGTYAAPQNLLLDHDNQTLFFQGSEIRFVGKGWINVDADNVTIDLQGGTISQYIGYAEVAVQTVDGSNQIIVTDASNLFIGQEITSSWGGGGGSGGSGPYPLGGPGISPKRKIANIVGNTVTLDSNMTAGDTLIPGVIVGDFTFGIVLQCFKNNLIVKNGSFERISGFYYFSPNGVVGIPIVPGGSIYFQNVNFNGNGADQFLLKHNQKLYLQNCTSVQQWDVAKSGVFFDDSASVYISNCDLRLGNFDSSFTMFAGWDGAFTGGEIKVSDSTISGKTRFAAPIVGTMANNCLNAFELIYAGSFNRISVSNSRFADYDRYFISSTVLTKTVQTVLESLLVDNCRIDGSFSYWLHSGSGNGVNCPSVLISNTEFYQRNGYIFHQVTAISGASSVFTPFFSDCYFNWGGAMAGFTKFGSPASVADSRFNMNSIAYLHSQGLAELDNCLFTNNPTINISPSFDENFYGELSRIVIDSPDFPQNPGAVFNILGGSSLSGAKVASARSIDGSVFYDVFKANTDVRVRGVFNRFGAATYRLRADDYYIPRGSNISDMNDGTIERVTFNLATTLAAGASSGATSIVVTDATGVAAGDRVNILLDDVLVDTRVVDGSYVSGTTIPLTAATTGAAASGNKVNFFRVAAL